MPPQQDLRKDEPDEDAVTRRLAGLERRRERAALKASSALRRSFIISPTIAQHLGDPKGVSRRGHQQERRRRGREESSDATYSPVLVTSPTATHIEGLVPPLSSELRMDSQSSGSA